MSVHIKAQPHAFGVMGLIALLTGCDGPIPVQDVSCQLASGGCGGDGSPPPDTVLYTAGHGDLAFEIEESEGELDVHFHVEGATIDGESDVTGKFSTEELLVRTNATFRRPLEDQSLYAPLCVSPGKSVYWLPQSNGAATKGAVPFMGIANEIPSGVFLGDTLTLRLLSVDSPTGSGAYSLWQDGFPPDFAMSSCSGIGEDDGMTLVRGHDHYNMGFANDGPGLWSVSYRISGRRRLDGSPVSTDFTVHYDIR